MALVPVSPGATVDSRPAPFVPQNAQFDPNAFGAGIGQATQGLGRAIGADAEEGAKIATNMAIQNDTRAAKASDTQHQTAVTALGFTNLPGGPEGNKGYYSLQGQDAVTYRPAYEKALNDSNTAISDGLKDSPRAQNFYNAQAGMRVSGEVQRSAQYAMHQGLVADNNASAARLGAYKDSLTVNYNDPNALANFQQVTRGEVADTGRRMGWGTDEIAAATTKALSGGYRDAILTRVNSGDVAGALEMFDKLAPGMDAATRVSLGQHLLPIKTGAQADALVQTLMGGGRAVGSGLGGTSGPIDAQSQARAQAVHDGMVKRGFDSDTGWGFAANALHESAGDPATGAGDGGAAHGLFMWRDSRRQAFQDQHGGKLPEQTSLDTQLDFAASELKGSEAAAATGIGQARGPAGKAAAVSTLYLRPKDTTAEEQRRGATATQLAGSGMQAPYQIAGPPVGNATDANPAIHPDFAGMQQKLLDLTADNPQLQAAALHRLHTAANQYELSTQADRDKLSGKEWDDKIAAATAGNDTVSMDEAMIRHVFRPEKADYMVGQFNEAVQAGQINGSLKLATPAQANLFLATMSADLKDEDPAHFVQRRKALAQAQTFLGQRQKALDDDPAAYAAKNDPNVAAAYKAVDQQKPETLQAAVDASFSSQRTLGVADPRVLTTPDAAAMVKKIETPTNGDMGAQLNQLEQQYGSHYGDVVADLTKAGLSPRYQMLAHANLPEQATVRNDAQAAFQMFDGLKDKSEWAKGVPVDQEKLLRPAVDEAVRPYRQTLQGSTDPHDTLGSVIIPAITQTAQYYMTRGMPTQAAVDKAAALITKSYKFDDELRVPAAPGMPTVSAVRDSMTTLTGGLNDADLRGTTAAEARYYGTWMTNPDDKGATLFKGTSQGGYMPVRKADGSYLSVDFKKLPTATTGASAAVSQAPAPAAQALGAVN